MKCKSSVFEHNKAIFHLGQCPYCYQSNVINETESEDVEEGEEIVVSMAGKKLKRDVDYSYENGVITIFNHNINS